MRSNAEAAEYEQRMGGYVPLSIRYGTDAERKAWENSFAPGELDALRGHMSVLSAPPVHEETT